jgi:hypothetical protein
MPPLVTFRVDGKLSWLRLSVQNEFRYFSNLLCHRGIQLGPYSRFGYYFRCAAGLVVGTLHAVAGQSYAHCYYLSLPSASMSCFEDVLDKQDGGGPVFRLERWFWIHLTDALTETTRC